MVEKPACRCNFLRKDRTIWLYDNNEVANITGYPLDHRGMVVSNPIMYPTLVDSYRFKMARFFNMAVTEMESPTSRMHRATVRATFEIVWLNIFVKWCIYLKAYVIRYA